MGQQTGVQHRPDHRNLLSRPQGIRRRIARTYRRCDQNGRDHGRYDCERAARDGRGASALTGPLAGREQGVRGQAVGWGRLRTNRGEGGCEVILLRCRFNSYWEMPFRRSVRITVENLSGEDIEAFFYQITYARTDVPDDCAYLHAQWRRSNPVTGGIHTLLDGVHGQGHYVGTYLAWGVNNGGWWGEGEVKFYFDGDDEYPTICGTGTEDYFGGAWEFEYPKGQYGEYTSPYLGMPQVIRPDGFHVTQQRFGMYRWHLPDPVRFKESLRVTVQALGWRHPYAGKPTYLVLQDDIASTSWWYQTAPHAPFPRLPPVDQLEVI